MTHQDYYDCLMSGTPLMRTMNVLRSHKHMIYWAEINKCALSANDGKRVIMEDGICTRAVGHWRLTEV